MLDISELKAKWAGLGFDPTQITELELIRERERAVLCRITEGEKRYVAKSFPDEASAREIRIYGLLQECGVETITTHARFDTLLLMEDLSTSPQWRLARPDDLHEPSVGAALGEWYRPLHAAGSEYLAMTGSFPSFLEREIDALTEDSIAEIAHHFDTRERTDWRRVADHLEFLKTAYRALANTFVYNDFDYSNVAVSRASSPSTRAVLFDFHLAGIGLRYSDCRNVVGELGDEAKEAFWGHYGSVDPREAILDKPLATLYALLVAVRLPRFPSWARACEEEVSSGAFHQDFEEALPVAASIISS